MAIAAMPSKRKFSSITPNTYTVKTCPTAPQKPGKLKSILKKPSPSARFAVACTPPSSASTQLKLEFAAVQRSVDGSTHTMPPASAKKPKLDPTPESKLQSKPQHFGSMLPSPPSDHNLDIIEDSDVEAKPTKTPRKTSSPPKYENDGDVEGLITDKRPHVASSDDTFLMSGGLGPGESPYKKVAESGPAERKSQSKSKKEKVPLSTLDLVSVPSSGTQAVNNVEQTISDQGTSGRKATVFGKTEIPESPGPESPDASPLKCESVRKADRQPEATLPTPTHVPSVPLPSKTRKQEASSPANIVSTAPVSSSPVKTRAVPLTPASSKPSRLERRKAAKSSSPALAEVTKILTEYEQSRETETAGLQQKLQTYQNRVAQLEIQLDLFQREMEAQSKRRQIQSVWQRNKFTVFSRRIYSLQGEEETAVVGGSDDLAKANEIAKAKFMGEMKKLESVVEDLGRVDSFCEMGCGMQQVQMRVTKCGMVKFRECAGDSRWELTVERVAGF